MCFRSFSLGVDEVLCSDILKLCSIAAELSSQQSSQCTASPFADSRAFLLNRKSAKCLVHILILCCLDFIIACWSSEFDWHTAFTQKLKLPAAQCRQTWDCSSRPGLACLLGPNGCGKSAFVEAIVFAYGASTTQLRARSLSELVHRGAETETQQPAPPNCYVELALYDKIKSTVTGAVHDACLETGQGARVTLFRRGITAAGASAYTLQGKKVTQQQYLNALREHGLDLSRLRCLVVGQHKVSDLVNAPGGNLLANIESMLGTDRLALQEATAQAWAAVFGEEANKASLAAATHLPDLNLQLQRAVRNLEENAATMSQLPRESHTESGVTVAHSSSTLDEVSSCIQGALSATTVAVGAATQHLQAARQQETLLKQQARAIEDAKLKAMKAAIKAQLALKTARHTTARQQTAVQQLTKEHSSCAAAAAATDTLLEQLHAAQAAGKAAEQGDSVGAALSDAGSASKQIAGLLGMDLRAILQAREHHRACQVAVENAKSSLAEAELNARLAQEQLHAPQQEELVASKKLKSTQAALTAARRQLADAEGWHHDARRSHQRLQQPASASTDSAGSKQQDGVVTAQDPAVRFLQCLDLCKSQFPDDVYGLLGDDILQLPDKAWSLAVHQVLRGALKRTVVVSNRATAAAVAHAFTQHRAGVVSCAILDELTEQHSGAGRGVLPRAAKAAGALLAVHAVAVTREQFVPLLTALLGGWLLVKTVDDAVLLRQRGVTRNMVTQNGSVFRSSGEVTGGLVVPGPSRGVAARFMIPVRSRRGGDETHRPQNIPSGRATPEEISQAEAELREAAAAVHSAKHALHAAQQTTSQAESAAHTAASRAAEHVRHAQQLQQQAGSRRATLRRARDDYRKAAAAVEAASKGGGVNPGEGGGSGLALMLTALQAKIHDTQRESTKLQTRLARLQRQLNTAQTELTACQEAQEAAQEAAATAEAEQLRATEGGQGGVAPAQLQRAAQAVSSRKASMALLQKQQQCLRELSQRIPPCRAVLAASLPGGGGDEAEHQRGQMRTAAQQLRRTLGQGLSLAICAISKVDRKELHKLRVVQGGDSSPEVEGGHTMQALLGRLEQEIEQAKTCDPEHMKRVLSSCSEVLNWFSLSEHAVALLHKQEHGGTVMEEARGTAQLAERAVEACELLTRPSNADVVKRDAKTGVVGLAAAGTLQRDFKTYRRTMTPLVDAGAPPTPDELQNAKKSFHSVCKLVEDVCTQLEHAAAARRAALDTRTAAAEQVAHACTQVQGCLQADAGQSSYDALLDAVVACVCADAQTRRAVTCADQRFDTLTSALTAAEARLGEAFTQLTQVGQCTLLYNPQREALYSEGVTLECCPTGHGWRLFRELSGGQQAMAALALLLTLQTLQPAPLYILDEVDAALDADKVCRAAALLQRSLRGSEGGVACAPPPPLYLVVTHREHMYEAADCIVGVYGAHDGTHLVACRVPPRDMSCFLGGGSTARQMQHGLPASCPPEAAPKASAALAPGAAPSTGGTSCAQPQPRRQRVPVLQLDDDSSSSALDSADSSSDEDVVIAPRRSRLRTAVKGASSR